MQTRKAICWSVWFGILAAGCDAPPAPVPQAEPAAESRQTAALFDARSAGTVSGRVTWAGEVPEVPPYRVLPVMSIAPELRQLAVRANPNAPQIDPTSRAVGSAVVFLRGVDPQRSRPWDLPPVEVHLKDLLIQVVQEGLPRRYGFVRCGAEVRMVSRQLVLHALHADGAAFFTLPFPDPDQPLSRRLGTPGVVELSSGVGYYWMRAYLFVSEHPYYCCTDSAGHFTLPTVPAGDYDLVCWMPSWIEEGCDRDPENFQPVRIRYRPPVEKIIKVTVTPGQTTETSFRLSTGDFERKK
jgi:hypothetical protein